MLEPLLLDVTGGDDSFADGGGRLSVALAADYDDENQLVEMRTDTSATPTGSRWRTT